MAEESFPELQNLKVRVDKAKTENLSAEDFAGADLGGQTSAVLTYSMPTLVVLISTMPTLTEPISAMPSLEVQIWVGQTSAVPISAAQT